MYLVQSHSNYSCTQAEFKYDGSYGNYFQHKDHLSKTEADVIPESNASWNRKTTTDLQLSKGEDTNGKQAVLCKSNNGFYSEEYIQFNLSSFAKKVSRELELWCEKGTENAIIHVAEIRSLIKEYSPYVRQNADARIVISIISLLFENNQWENFQTSKLEHMRGIINRFADNTIERREVEAFIRDI
ncbi:MAG: hypothetical protein U9O78_00025, partial [Patescibacteria group bacterium]|nr:hypothetical protein [Patescibacteria group bacterium]